MDDRAANMSAPRVDTTSDPDTDRRAREIRSEIERTREDLSETVGAIQEKLRPSNVVANAASATTEKVKTMADRAMGTAEEWGNLVPAVLAGVGLTWLALSNGRMRRHSASSPSGELPRGMANAREAVRRSGRRFESMIRSYPLAVGAAAAIVGAALGMAVPETERENELMGEAREHALQRAQEAATGVVDRAKEAAADVVTRAAIGD